MREEGKLAGGWLTGRGKEALYGREVLGGTGDVELGRIWFRVRRCGSLWNGLVAEGALSPERKGFLVLAGGLAGIRESRSTSEAAVGSRKDSGVRQDLELGAARLSPSRDRSKSSGLLWSRPFTFI